MDTTIKTALDKIIECINKQENFVLQGGAGSGKTETLKRVLEYISQNLPDKKIVCITHTNLAVAEIKSRVGENDNYTISTIHSFLNSLIENYKVNIQNVIQELFILEKIDRKDISFYENETEQKKKEHQKYTKTYKKFSKSLFEIKEETVGKPLGKREYDNDPEKYNLELNQKIENLNIEIQEKVKSFDFNTIKYNDTPFDRISDMSFGHDGLIKISQLLFEKFPLLSKILQDKYDYIFIDEYQDTQKPIIDIFLRKVPYESNLTVSLFGDSMQGIYDDGVGDVDTEIEEGIIKKISKEDNYRCSEQIINFINTIRNDGLEQKLALKKGENPKDRQGFVKLYYSIIDNKPHARSSDEEKNAYIEKLNNLIKTVENRHNDINFKKLMLTNKSIAKELNFENLYKIFDDRYGDVKEEIEKCLSRLQILELVELYHKYQNKEYNFILTKIKKSGFEINTISDKQKVDKLLNDISKEKKIFELLNFAFENKLLSKSDSYTNYIKRKDLFLKELNKDFSYQEFKKFYVQGGNTQTRMKKAGLELENEVFNEKQKLFKKEQFYEELFSDKILFKEVINYFSYLEEKEEYITMHKTKGSSIENVLVVLDEYFWSKYNFKVLFEDEQSEKKTYNLKLFYVACSRAIKNLVCIRLITSEEEENIKKFFPDNEKVK